MLNTLFKSIIDSDGAPVVICDTNSTIVYMNPASIKRYNADLTGKSINACHPPKANEMIDKVLEWFSADANNNIIYTYRSENENKDIYMVALRDDDKNLIGYYEKHMSRNHETATLYEPIKV